MKYGTIILWFGALNNIPQSWHLCDGNGGTPNLFAKFIVGAGDTYDPGDKKDDVLHYHDYTSDGHMHTLLLTPADIGQDGGTYRTLASSVDTGETAGYPIAPPWRVLGYIMKMC